MAKPLFCVDGKVMHLVESVRLRITETQFDDIFSNNLRKYQCVDKILIFMI